MAPMRVSETPIRPVRHGEPPKEPIPPLEAGDRLTRDEFERRYEAMPRLKKAELIERVVYMPSPVRIDQHSGPQGDLITWLGHYRAYAPRVRLGDNSTVRLDLDNEPQPDGLLLIEPASGGQAAIREGYVIGGPELVAEVASSSASYDVGPKLRVYRRNGVREYIVWRVLDNAVDWFVLRQSQYEQLIRGASGFLESEVFPGLWLDPEALIRGDLARVLAVLQQGLQTPEHADFIAKLQKATRPSS